MSAQYVIGVDVGGTTVKMGLFTAEGDLLKKWEIPTRTENGGEAIIPDIAASVRGVMAASGIVSEDVRGIGIGVPGATRSDGYVALCPNLGWRNVYPGRLLTDILDGIPVKVSNDANVAALGEQWLGCGRGTKNLFMITLGTGVGGGLVMDGKIINGANGLGAEIGHICVNPAERRQCTCGGYGCLEQYASATGVANTARQILAKSEAKSVLDPETVTAKAVFDAAKAGDAVAMEAAEVLFDYLGRELQNLTQTVEPELFAIGGGVSKAGDFLIDGIKRAYDRYMTYSAYRAKVVTATLGNDAGICGAARMMLD